MRLEPFLIVALIACNGGGDFVEVSQAPRVKAKGGPVWKTDLQRGLELESDEVCRELGLYDCVEVAHRITMGGVEAEIVGVDAPLETPPASAPIAFDRVALSACTTRYELDQAGSPVVFGDVLDSYNNAGRERVAERLVQRLLGRDATRAERSALVDLHDAIEPMSTDLAADWAIGACFIVATSTEALFY